MAKRRRFTPEFKAELVFEVLSHTDTICEVTGTNWRDIVITSCQNAHRIPLCCGVPLWCIARRKTSLHRCESHISKKYLTRKGIYGIIYRIEV